MGSKWVIDAGYMMRPLPLLIASKLVRCAVAGLSFVGSPACKKTRRLINYEA